VRREPVAALPPPAAVPKPADTTKSWIVEIPFLEKGMYYVQIATLSAPGGVDKIAAKYGKKYPLVTMEGRHGSTQVLVGPLRVDEYGAVLERFKAWGYKDAFLRIIR
jgi:hypothetical protein